MTAIVGVEVLNSNFKKKRIKISFNPLANPEKDEELFKVQDNAILKDKRWIPDIAVVFKSDFDLWQFVNQYCKDNPEISGSQLNCVLMRLIDIKNRQIGVITLSKDLNIDEVTEIFIRINSQGAKLNQADFAMSKIAANVEFGGNTLRKAIDYFSHLAVMPDWYNDMIKDDEFMQTCYASKLTEGVVDFMNQYSFTNFVLAMKSSGYISEKLINSQMTLDFAYMLYLLLNADSSVDKSRIKHYVTKWYVMSVLTNRYIGSPETVMDFDLRRIKERGFVEFFSEIEKGNLHDQFWEVTLVQRLETSVVNSPFFNTFLAAQIYFGDNALFSNGTKIGYLLNLIGDVHHIFPKHYLETIGIASDRDRNQLANFTYLDYNTNIDISDDEPALYVERYKSKLGEDNYAKHLADNAIPLGFEHLDYFEFLDERRKLMAGIIKKAYMKLWQSE